MGDSIFDFLFYYNDKFHSTTKATSYKAMMNDSDQKLMRNKRKTSLKMRLNAKTVSVTYPDGSYVRVSNYIKIIDKEYYKNF